MTVSKNYVLSILLVLDAANVLAFLAPVPDVFRSELRQIYVTQTFVVILNRKSLKPLSFYEPYGSGSDFLFNITTKVWVT
jgi:hypothetical protein